MTDDARPVPAPVRRLTDYLDAFHGYNRLIAMSVGPALAMGPLASATRLYWSAAHGLLLQIDAELSGRAICEGLAAPMPGRSDALVNAINRTLAVAGERMDAIARRGSTPASAQVIPLMTPHVTRQEDAACPA